MAGLWVAPGIPSSVSKMTLCDGEQLQIGMPRLVGTLFGNKFFYYEKRTKLITESFSPLRAHLTQSRDFDLLKQR